MLRVWFEVAPCKQSLGSCNEVVGFENVGESVGENLAVTIGVL